MSSPKIHHGFDDPYDPSETILEWRDGDVEVTVEICRLQISVVRDNTTNDDLHESTFPITVDGLQEALRFAGDQS